MMQLIERDTIIASLMINQKISTICRYKIKSKVKIYIIQLSTNLCLDFTNNQNDIVLK